MCLVPETSGQEATCPGILLTLVVPEALNVGEHEGAWRPERPAVEHVAAGGFKSCGSEECRGGWQDLGLHGFTLSAVLPAGASRKETTEVLLRGH